jgi:hypothetical protein
VLNPEWRAGSNVVLAQLDAEGLALLLAWIGAVWSNGFDQGHHAALKELAEMDTDNL